MASSCLKTTRGLLPLPIGTRFLFFFICTSRTKGTLHRTNRLTKSWKKLKPPSSASPLSKEIMLAFTHYFLSQNEKPAAICILLSWGALLRISETRHLYRRDVSLPTDLRAHSTNPNEIESPCTVPRQGQTSTLSFVTRLLFDLHLGSWKTCLLKP